MIHLLAEYSRKQGLEAEPGFAPKLVRWAICCDSKANYTGLIELGEAGAKGNRGRQFSCCPDLTQGELLGGGTRSHFLADSAEVLVPPLSKEPGKEILRKKHLFFGSLLQLVGTADESLRPPSTFYSQLIGHDLQAAVLADCVRQKVKPTDRVTLCLNGTFPLEHNNWHPWWREFRAGLGSPQPKQSQIANLAPVCFVTGQITAPEKTHLKISGLTRVGGQPAGDVLIGFDKDSFCSFEFSQGANACISGTAVAAYRWIKRLNQSIERDPRQRACRFLV